VRSLPVERVCGMAATYLLPKITVLCKVFCDASDVSGNFQTFQQQALVVPSNRSTSDMDLCASMVLELHMSVERRMGAASPLLMT
jgi:hypothetical protein